MQDRLLIEKRFNGPPGSANGGYTCGLIARHVGGPAEVTLRSPPPLGRSLAVRTEDDGTVHLLDGSDPIAEARPTALEVELPQPVTLADAEAASAASPWLEHHAFPGCFVCGPEREPGDGLRIFPGPVTGRDAWAAVWRPTRELAADAGAVREELVWAALDCPSAGPVANWAAEPPVVLAQLAARLDHPLPVGEPHVIVSWPIEVDGRKRYAGSAIFSADGAELKAVARALWIELKRAPS